MSGRFHLDQSIWVLLLVCVPLVVLLITLIALLTRGRRRTATFSGFSVTISQIGREEAYVKYASVNRHAEFPASIGRGRNFFRPSILVTMPMALTPEDLRKTVSDIALGLGSLGFEYCIYGNNKVLARSDT